MFNWDVCEEGGDTIITRSRTESGQRNGGGQEGTACLAGNEENEEMLELEDIRRGQSNAPRFARSPHILSHKFYSVTVPWGYTIRQRARR